MPDDDPIRRAAEAAYDWLNAPGQRDGSGTRSQLIGELAEVLRESDLARNAAAFDDLVDKLGLLQMALVATPGREWSIRLSPGMVMEIMGLLAAVEAAKEKS